MDDARGRWAWRLGRRLMAAALGAVLPCVVASAAAAQGPETIPAGDPALPVGLLVIAGIVGVGLVAGGAAVLIVGRRRARTDDATAEDEFLPDDAELAEVPEAADSPDHGADGTGSPQAAVAASEEAASQETDGQPQPRS